MEREDFFLGDMCELQSTREGDGLTRVGGRAKSRFVALPGMEFSVAGAGEDAARLAWQIGNGAISCVADLRTRD